MVKKNSWSASGFGKYVSPDLVDDEFLDVSIVILLQGHNLFGDKVYSYLELTGRNLKEMFAKMQTGEDFKPSDYGTVLFAGRGDPTPEVKEEVAKTYKMLDVKIPSPPSFTVSQPKIYSDDQAD